ncbi:hypothetical protein VP01_2338g5 [Puccinia sorghi]|uniref:Uncharacterized protein n=1 Tax=Puccinia sorghi TaxID=27349 RepID=A0A0L6V7D6_9BASI|nr:hypothetical protein VP01_2338g5 [Puccinia sorghi]
MDAQAASMSNSGDGFRQAMLKMALETIPQLTEENHSIWKDKMTALLKLWGVLKALEDPNIPLGESDNAELVMLLLSKMDNFAQRIWLLIKELFALSQYSNRARMFNNFLYVKFQEDAVELFVTDIKVAIKKLVDIGIELPQDILAYLALFKFPNSLQRRHLEKRELPLQRHYFPQKINHLERDKEAIETMVKPIPVRDVAADITIQSKTRTTAVTTAGICIPKLLRIGGKEKPKENYSMSLLTRWIESGDQKHRIILDSGASVHLFNDVMFFKHLELRDSDYIKTRKQGATLPIERMGLVRLR